VIGIAVAVAAVSIVPAAIGAVTVHDVEVFHYLRSVSVSTVAVVASVVIAIVAIVVITTAKAVFEEVHEITKVLFKALQ